MKFNTVNAALAVTALGAALLAGQAYAEHPKGRHHGPRYEKMMESIDTNKDGAITKEEHDVFTSARFKEMDTDGDGKVTKEELQKHHEEKMAKWRKGGAKPGDAPAPAKE